MSKMCSVFRSLTVFIMCIAVFVACQNKPKKVPASSEQIIEDESSETTDSVNYPDTEISEKKYQIPLWPRKAKQEKGKYFPYDEGPSDPAFMEFRRKLYNAVKNKNLAYIRSIIPNPENAPKGSDMEKVDFLWQFELDKKPKNPEFWNNLARCLEYGGGFVTYNNDAKTKERMFFAPYSFLIEDFMDPYVEGVILGENVRLREAPARDSKIVGALSWDHYFEVRQEEVPVEETIDGETHYWVQLKTKNGQEGYIYGKYAQAGTGYRAGFSEISPGKWLMTAFLAGD